MSKVFNTIIFVSGAIERYLAIHELLNSDSTGDLQTNPGKQLAGSHHSSLLDTIKLTAITLKYISDYGGLNFFTTASGDLTNEEPSDMTAVEEFYHETDSGTSDLHDPADMTAADVGHYEMDVAEAESHHYEDLAHKATHIIYDDTSAGDTVGIQAMRPEKHVMMYEDISQGDNVDATDMEGEHNYIFHDLASGSNETPTETSTATNIDSGANANASIKDTESAVGEVNIQRTESIHLTTWIDPKVEDEDMILKQAYEITQVGTTLEVK